MAGPRPRTPAAAVRGYVGATMPLMGTFWAVLGVVALVDREYVTVRTNRLLAVHTCSWWGWAHVLGGP